MPIEKNKGYGRGLTIFFIDIYRIGNVVLNLQPLGSIFVLILTRRNTNTINVLMMTACMSKYVFSYLNLLVVRVV